jgi:hypothetical protein
MWVCRCYRIDRCRRRLCVCSWLTLRLYETLGDAQKTQGWWCSPTTNEKSKSCKYHSKQKVIIGESRTGRGRGRGRNRTAIIAQLFKCCDLMDSRRSENHAHVSFTAGITSEIDIRVIVPLGGAVRSGSGRLCGVENCLLIVFILGPAGNGRLGAHHRGQSKPCRLVPRLLGGSVDFLETAPGLQDAQ